MSRSSRRIVFGRYKRPAPATTKAIQVYANDPVVRLTEGGVFLRNERQLARLRDRAVMLPSDGALFEASLEWAYRAYIVTRLSSLDQEEAATIAPAVPLPLGVAPVQPVSQRERRKQIKQLQPRSQPLPLCLFNLIVALEWHPSQRRLHQLAWAFRRASDFLYDATDGQMAFGQVVFGGPEALPYADIQIMASNRFHPRSWTGGFHEPDKFVPIRVGRGVWSKGRRVSIPWDEPEGYRVLVHEWGHYALELRDEYLELRQTVLAHTAGNLERHPLALVDAPDEPVHQLGHGQPAPLLGAAADPDGGQVVVVPGISLTTESIMATLEGTSELTPLINGTSRERRRRTQHWLEERHRFPFLDFDRLPLDGPGALPLPLPDVRRLPDLERRLPGLDDTTAALAHADEVLLTLPAGQITPDHGWIYLVGGGLDAPERLIAQGSVDAWTEREGFRLLGAAQEDSVILIGYDDARQPVALQGRITAINVDAEGEQHAVIDWQTATPAVFPLVDVLPELVSGSDQMAAIRVQITPPPAQAWVFPLGQGQALAVGDEPLAVTALDGHVLARWDDGTLAVCTFSQGGGPRTNGTSGPPPISAGSAEGNLMLFFADNGDDVDHTDVRAVTTLLTGLPDTLPNGAQARSYAFSLASTRALPTELHPTLILYYDRFAAARAGELLIHRQQADQSWAPLPSYQRHGSSYVAAPLSAPNAGGSLTAAAVEGPRVERYRLFWTPLADA